MRSVGSLKRNIMTAYPLRQLEAEFQRVVTVTTTEIETGNEDPSLNGLYLFRETNGEKFMWGPRPERYEFHNVGSVGEADQIFFLCPLCFEKNGGSKGTHGVDVSFAGRNIPDEAGTRDSTGKPSRWTVVSGTSLDDLVLAPSILLDAGREPDKGCHWHGFVGFAGIPPGHAG